MKTVSRRLHGFSLIELLLVLGVIAVLLVAAFVIYPQVRLANQADTEVKNVTAIMANMETAFRGKTSGITTALANQARVFPSSMNGGNYTASAPIQSSWGGSVRLMTTGVASFDVVYQDVSKEMCLKWLPALTLNFQWVQIQKGAAGGGGQTWLKNPTHHPEMPTTTEIVTACTNNGDPFLVAVGYR